MTKNIFKILTTSLILILTMAFLSACGKDKAGEKAGSLTVKGSDTMVHLVSTWAEAFMKKNLGTEISVTGGGSGTGIAALLNKTTDIAAASRKIKYKEKKLAEQQGAKVEELAVARDGIAVVVNPENPVSELSIEQIGQIFTGQNSNWNQVSGPDAETIVLSRESSSGTYVFFQKQVLNKKDYSPKARLMPATSAIIQAVSTDKWAIGYVGLGYALEAKNKVKVISVKTTTDSPAVVPSDETIKSGEYSIARPLHFYAIGKQTGVAKNFIDFCLSSEGQKIVRETGYVPIN